MISPCKIIDIFLSSKQKAAFCLILYVFFTFNGYSQAVRADYQAYIEQYRATALQHQQVFGIPASITLAQGLLESRAGKSGLAVNGNNHFGIKNFNWHGEVLCYGDSANMSCYRKYGAPEDSFLDHARFLKSKRYGKLYELDITDYRGWAEGLRECGYAEDPAYPQKLIGIIEQYRLHELDAPMAIAVASNQPTTTSNIENTAETKAAKRARERAEKQALKQAQKEAREKEKLAKQQEKKARELEKKAHEQQLKEQRALERLAHEQQERAQREQQRRERAERYAQRHSSDSNDNVSPLSTTRRTAQNATRSNGNTVARGYASADND